jgi:hypothetical protein
MFKAVALASTALTILLCNPEPAAAGPLIGAAVAVFSAVATGTGIVNAVVSLALAAATTLYSMATAPDAPPPVGAKIQADVGDDQPVSTTIGQYATRGKRKYVGTWGNYDGDTPNTYLTEVYELGTIPLSGLDGIWIEGEKCTILWNEPDTVFGRGYPLKEYRDTEGTVHDYCWVKFYNGSQTVTDPFLLKTFKDDKKRPWDATMIGRGIPYAIMTYRWERDYFKGQPKVLFEPAPLPLYDIRKDSTNGGNGAHRWDDPSTHEPSYNLAVMTYNVLRGLRYKGEWFYGGQKVDARRLPSSNWIAACQEAGRLVERADGSTEPQWRGGYEITGDMVPLTVIEELRKAQNGRLTDQGGVFKMKNGIFGAPVFGFTDADTLISEPSGFDPFPSVDLTINGVTGKYPNPEEAWVAKDAPVVRSDAFEALDGKRNLADISFGATSHNRQVQQLMRAILAEARRFRRHQVPMPPMAYVLEAGIDVVSWTSQHNGYVNKRFLVTERRGQMDMNQIVTLQEIDPTDYDWVRDMQQVTSSGWIGRIDVPVQPMTGWDARADIMTDPDGQARRPVIIVSCAANLADVARVLVRVRLKATGAVVFESDQFPYSATSSEWILTGMWLWPATEYEVQGKLVPYSSRKTDDSAWIPLTTPDIGFSSKDLIDNAVTQQKIAEAAISASKIADEAVTGVKLANQAVTTAKIALAAVTSLLISDGAVIAAKLADAAVTISKIQDGAVIASKVADGAIERDKLAAQAVDATKFASGIQPIGVVEGTVVPTTKTQEIITIDGKLYRWTNGAYSASVPSVEISGTIVSSQIADAAITAQKLAAAAIDATKFASGIRPVEAVSALPTTGNVQGRTVILTTDGKLYRYVGSAFTSAVPSIDITGQLVSSQISDLAITNAKLAALAVDANKLATNAVTNTKIADDAISTPKLQANAVVADKIAANAISARQLILADFENFIQDGQFEQGSTPDLWNMSVPWNGFASLGTSPAAWLWTGDTKTGRYSLILDNGKAGGSGGTISINMITKDYIPITSLDWLSWEAVIRTTDGSSPAGFYYRIFWFDRTKTALPGNQFTDVQGNQPIPSSWEKRSGKIQVPDNAAYCQIQIYHHSTSTTRYLIIDRLSLRKAEGAKLVVDGSISTVHLAADSITTDKIAANAVTAAEIAANAITAGKIAAGAVAADQIAANAITAAKIAAGAISADKLAVGTGRNMIPNSDLRAGTTGWQANVSGGDWGNPILEMRTDQFGVAGTGSLQVLQRGAQVNDQFADVSPIDPATKQIMRFPVKAGGNYEISIYAFGHRSSYVRAYVDWRDRNNNNLGYGWYDGPSHQNFDPQGQLSNYLRIGGRLNPAPAGTAFAYVFFRCWGHSAAYGVDSYTWLALPYFGECNPNQTELSPWGPAGVTLIDAGNIVTNAITSDKIAASAITAGKLAAGAVTAGTIAANAVTAGTIAVGAVSADQIAANAITAVKIAGGTITGDKLAVRTISADSLLAATITGYEIKADTITGSHIAALTITANELAANSVVAGKLAANAVTAGTIAANAISAINIQGSTITGDKLQGATISGDKLQANTLGAREIAAGSISAKQLVITDFSNLVPDNQMTSTEAWVGTIPGWIVWGDHGLFQSYNGMQFGAGPWGSGGYTNCQSRSFPVKGATSYRFTGAIYSNSNYNAFIRVLWLDANGALAGYYDHASTGNRGAGGTGLQTVNLVSPANAATSIIELFVQRNNTAGPVFFGSIGAFERNAGELIVDGAIKAAQIAADAITTAMLQAGSVTTDKLVVGGVSYDKLAARATGYLGVSANPDAFTITTAFQARVSADVTKPSQDGLEVVASFRVRCTNLGGATSASVQFRLREYLNGAYTSDVEYGKVYFTDTSQDVNDVISAYLIHMKPAGPSGNYSYALEIKKNTAASDFTIGVGRIGVKLGTKTG